MFFGACTKKNECSALTFFLGAYGYAKHSCFVLSSKIHIPKNSTQQLDCHRRTVHLHFVCIALCVMGSIAQPTVTILSTARLSL